MRVAVLTTGKAELIGLHLALKRLFPEHEFLPVPGRQRDTPFNGVTSTRITQDSPVSRSTTAMKLIQSAAAALEDHDRVIILDDLELENLTETVLVLEYVRAHVQRHIEWIAAEYGKHEGKALAAALSTRASFHLAVPMLESWFFADPAALRRLGVQTRPRLTPPADPEQFQTDHPAYEQDSCSDCTEWLAITDPTKRRSSCPEWDRSDREHHPKAYLAWLMKDPGNKRCSRYRETVDGALAITKLDWQVALADADHCAYLRAFVFDLSQALSAPLPWLNESTQPALTEYVWPGKVLRNI